MQFDFWLTYCRPPSSCRPNLSTEHGKIMILTGELV